MRWKCGKARRGAERCGEVGRERMEEDVRGRKRMEEDMRGREERGEREDERNKGNKGTGLARGQRVAEGVWEAVKNGGACCKIGIFSWSSVQF